MPTRREITVACLDLSLGAGCSGITGRNPSNIEDYSRPIYIENNHDREHVVDVAIDGPDGQRYKAFGVHVPPDTQVDVRPFTDLARTDIEAFQVTITVEELEDEPQVRTAEMNRCFGGIDVLILEDGELSAGILIC